MTSDREQLDQHDKYVGFKRAFMTLKTYREMGNMIGAFVVAFSLFEDRVTASLMLSKDKVGHKRPHAFESFTKKVRFLEHQELINSETAKRWMQGANRRNDLVHSAMWNLDAFKDEDVAYVTKLAREADKLSCKLKPMQVPSEDC